MMPVTICVARQPIFDRSLHVFGYELLYRASEEQNYFTDALPDEASSRVVMDSFHGIGINKMVGRSRAFINFTGHMLESEVATLFPPKRLVVEILESVAPSDAVVEKCQSLKARGYQLALDDFVFTEQYLPLVQLCDIIKIDFRSTSREDIAGYIRRFKRHGLRFLAEKIETREEFDEAVALGFKYFQGYFLSRPVILRGEKLRPLNSNYVRLLQIVNRQEYSLREVADIIEQDLSMSYDILRMVNSVAMGFIIKIQSVRHAVVAMGMNECRKWVSLVAMAGINKDQPTELLHLSLIRARFAQNLGRLTRAADQDLLFMMGLFSTMDVITGNTFAAIFRAIPAAPDVVSALTQQTGPLAPYLALIFAQERGQWEEAARLGAGLSIPQVSVTNAYLDALSWCIGIFEGTA